MVCNGASEMGSDSLSDKETGRAQEERSVNRIDSVRNNDSNEKAVLKKIKGFNPMILLWEYWISNKDHLPRLFCLIL